MQWYDPILGMIFFAGVLLIALSHYHGKEGAVGLLLILTSVIIKTSIWFAGMI